MVMKNENRYEKWFGMKNRYEKWKPKNEYKTNADENDNGIKSQIVIQIILNKNTIIMKCNCESK